ncbi:MAG: carboxypeptidase regulatory-like domain-containing protein [Bacteroidetes bacterium]|nr:carboxypeptidase regulatory-like domain-containing protein [Bacteroidota bacterium]
MDKRQTIYIALTKGVRLTGTLLVDQDKYSNVDVKMDIARIRVTAIDSSGKTYSALTDRNGNFMMYVPTGIYTLTVNESALGNNYMLLQNKISIDLSYFTDNFSITFNAVEKKRKMNIKKFNLQGEEQK